MRKIILALVLTLILLINISLAGSLGVYKAGDTVTYSVVCLTDEGAKDTGCSASDDDILDPDDTTAKTPTSALAEVSDTNFPGLWRGSYTIPASPLAGTWSIFIELTNTNSTTAGTVLNFQVLSDSNYPASHGDLGSGIVTLTSATETQIDDILTDTAAQDTSTKLRTLLTGTDTAVSTLTASDNIGVDFDDITGTLDSAEIGTDAITSAKIAADAIGASEAGFLTDSTGFNGGDISSILTDTNEIQGNQSNFVTATGFSTHSAADVWTTGSRELSTPDNYKATGFSTLTASDNIGINWADVSNPTTSVDLSGTNFNLVDTCSALTTNNDKTGYSLTSITETQIDNIEADTNEIQQNQSNFVTATGFSTHSAADVWTAGSRSLSIPNDYKADVSSLATTSQLNSNVSTIIDHGDVNWITSTTGLSSSQNETLYNISDVIGENGKYDQSLADMLAYNASDGNVETDLDTLGGTTPAAVWGYNITGLNQTTDSAGWYVTTIKTIVEWIEWFF